MSNLKTTETLLQQGLCFLKVGKAEVACIVEKPYPGNYAGPPDSWEPPDPGYIGAVHLFLPSKNLWAPVSIDKAPHLEDQIWDALEVERTNAWDALCDEMFDEG